MKLKSKIIDIKKELEKAILLERRVELNDELKKLKKEIKVLSKKKKRYLLDNSKFIFDYFEKKREISEGNSKKKILHSFLNNNISLAKRELNVNNRTQMYYCTTLNEIDQIGLSEITRLSIGYFYL